MIGILIKRERSERKWTLTELSERLAKVGLRIHHTRLSVMENEAKKGKPKTPHKKFITLSDDEVEAISMVFNLDRLVVEFWNGRIPISWRQKHIDPTRVRVGMTLLAASIEQYGESSRISYDAALRMGLIELPEHPKEREILDSGMRERGAEGMSIEEKAVLDQAKDHVLSTVDPDHEVEEEKSAIERAIEAWGQGATTESS